MHRFGIWLVKVKVILQESDKTTLSTSNPDSTNFMSQDNREFQNFQRAPQLNRKRAKKRLKRSSLTLYAAKYVGQIHMALQ